MLPIDRRSFLASLGGAAAVELMSQDTRADALEQNMLAQLNKDAAGNNASARLPTGAGTVPDKLPTVAELDAQITTRNYRRGVGRLLWNRDVDAKVVRLAPMPKAPTVADYYALRLMNTGNHCLQSANKALHRGADQEVVLACLLHDISQELMCADHGYWGAQMIEPYVSERVFFAVKYHQPLRFFPDEKAGYQYPDIYRKLYGSDYVPDERMQATYKWVKNHRWYDAPREVTVSDLYAFDPKAVITIDPFVDIIGRHFKQPKEGLGNDNSSVAHMWRTLSNPDAPL